MYMLLLYLEGLQNAIPPSRYFTRRVFSAWFNDYVALEVYANMYFIELGKCNNRGAYMSMLDEAH